MVLVKAVKRAPLSLAPALTFFEIHFEAELFCQSGPRRTAAPLVQTTARMYAISPTERRRDFVTEGERKQPAAVELGYFRRCVRLQEASLSEPGWGGAAVQALDSHFRVQGLTSTNMCVSVRVRAAVCAFN